MLTRSVSQSRHDVFVDWLTFTFAPSESFLNGLVDSLALCGYSLFRGDLWSDKQTYKIAHHLSDFPAMVTGSVHVEKRDTWWMVSISGAALRVLDHFNELVGVIQAACVEPSLRVTRLDLSKDFELDSAQAVSKRLRSILRKGQQGKFRLGQKAISASQVSQRLTYRGEGPKGPINTGSVYLGNRSNALSACIYDKRAEMAAHHDIDIGRELLRYEVRVRKGQATLRDVVDPDPLYFRLVSPDLLPRPSDVAKWERVEMDPRLLPPMQRMTTYERICRVIDCSSDLQVLRKLLQDEPKAGPMVLEKIEHVLRAEKDAAA